jgi:flagellar motor component MotA
MAIEPLITWDAPAHLYVEKRTDWYWAVGLITLALAAVALLFGEVITGIFIVVGASALVLHASHPPKTVHHEINDRGIMTDSTLYPFLSLDSFWIPHDELPPKIILKSRKLLMPYIVMYIDEVDPEKIREILLKYIAETEHHEHFLKHLLERFGF